jgi:adenylate cyclase
MSVSSEQRRLAAIMFTDMVGYTALAQGNEALALELLEEHRRILRSIFPRFNGTEIKTIGDAFLVEFQSALEAAQCALEIQRTLAKRNHDVSAERQIQVRIGVHIGDVVHRNGDVYGDGVNIASRIEPLAGAGGICVSMDVERQIRNALEARLEKLAPTELKNITVPMDLFRIVLPWERQSKAEGGRKKEKKSANGSRFPASRLAWVAALVLVLGAGWWWSTQSRRILPSPARASAPQTVDQKSIAVLPFENLSDEKQNEYFADGVQDEILTDLAKLPDLKVISRTSVIRYRTGAARDLREIGQQLGVAHIVEGSVQRSGDRVRVNAQLIDARSDAHLWAKTYDRSLADVFAIQSEIATSIAQELKANLLPNIKAAIEQPPTADVIAFDLYTRAKTLLLDVGFSGYKKGIDMYNRATELLNAAVARDPTFFLAYCQLARVQGEVYFFSIDHTPARRGMIEEAVRNAERLRPDAGETHLARALYFYHGYLDYDRARSEVQIAAGSLPNDPQVCLLTAYLDRRQNRWSEALHNLQKGLELDPHNVYVLRQISLTYQILRRYAEMVAVLDRALALDPTDIDSRIGRARAELHWRADTQPLHKTIHAILASDPSAAENLADWWFDLALCERAPSEIRAALAAISEAGVRDEGLIFPRAYCQGMADLARSNSSSARAAFLKARAEQEKAIRDQPEYGAPVCVLGMIDAALGRKDEAIAEGRRAAEMLPVTKEPINGANVMKSLAAIYALCGEKDLAIEQIRTTLEHPGDLSYGLLKLHPYWDSLRGDPRFEQIVASLAPKDAALTAK